MNGYELCKYIKSDLEINHIPIVLLTARSDSDSTYLGYKLGVDSYISKPFEVDFLLTILNNLLKNKELMKQRYKNSFDTISPSDITFSNADEKFLIDINDLIINNMSNTDLNVKFITEQMAMSRTSLYSKVKAITDMGVNDYITKLRIDKATSLLLHSEYNITEIAFETDFTYQRYFSTTFKQATGMFPTEFKEKHLTIL